MNKTLKYSLIGVGITAAGLVAWSLYRRWRIKRASQGAIEITPSDGSIKTTPKGDDKLPLKKGSYGERVKLVQQALVNNKFCDVVYPQTTCNYDLGTSGPNRDGVDGDFGTKTDAAVRKFQEQSAYAASYAALSSGTPVKGEVDAVTFLLITGKAA